LYLINTTYKISSKKEAEEGFSAVNGAKIQQFYVCLFLPMIIYERPIEHKKFHL
jgi:hypothetical protein